MAHTALDAAARPREVAEQPLGRRDMTPNAAGGYAFPVDVWTQLDRFLILGTEGGTFYANQRKITTDRVESLIDCLETNGERTVERIVQISQEGRAPRNDQALFALALAAGTAKPAVQALALEKLHLVARTATHLFMFLGFLKQFRGFGRGVKRAVAQWYASEERNPVYQMVKYRNREGWTHRDVLRMMRPLWGSGTLSSVARWAVDGVYEPKREPETSHETEMDSLMRAYLELQKAETPLQATAALSKHRALTHEMLPAKLAGNPAVWEAMLDRLPITALMRNLGRVTSYGLLPPMSKAAESVALRLSSSQILRRGRVHPISVLLAAATYANGGGHRGQLTWTPSQEINKALDTAFYSAYRELPSIPKRVYVAVDVSASMTWNYVADGLLDARTIGAAVAMCLAKQCSKYVVAGFSGGMHQSSMVDLASIGVNPDSTVQAAVQAMGRVPAGYTRMATPIEHALSAGIEADAFVVITDNEANSGPHPFQKLLEYRSKTGIAAKMAVLAVTATDYSVADPTDAGMMDIVGFDAAAPRVLADFIAQ